MVAYALAGIMHVDLLHDPLGGADGDGRPVYLRAIWPSPEEIAAVADVHLRADMVSKVYADVGVPQQS